MAKERMVNTKFWDDTYIANLDPIEKLLYLYFLTNPLTNICGIYEIQLRRIAFDTGIDRDMVLKILDRFAKDKKIYYLEGWLAIKNFAKHQKDNPKVKKGIEIAMQQVPSEIIDRIYKENGDRLSHSNSNSNSNLNTNAHSAVSAKSFKKPTLEEVREYCRERGNKVDPQQWMDHYTSNGWKVGKNPMKDWKAAIRTWEKNSYGTTGSAKLIGNVYRNDNADDIMAKVKVTKINQNP